MRRRLVLIAGWAAATAAVVGLGWAAVAAVTGTVTDPPPLAQPPAPAGAPTGADDPTPERTPRGQGQPAAPQPASTDPAAPQPASTDPAAPEPAGTDPAAPEPAGTQPPDPDQREDSGARTFDLAGGTVGVRVGAASVELMFATPRSAFTVDVRSRGPSRVEVRFSSDDHESRFRYDVDGGERLEERPG